MNFVLLATSYWADAKRAESRKAELLDWHARALRFFGPMRAIVATGSCGDVEHNPLKKRIIVQPSYAPTPARIHINPNYCDGWSAAFMAGCFRALQSFGWDLVVVMETDVIIGTFEKSLLSRFLQRKELIMAPHWHDGIDTNFMVLRRDACSRYLHCRLRPNYNFSDKPMMCAEEELKLIFNGLWWDPWPKLKTIRQDFGYQGALPDSDFANAPIIRAPSTTIKKLYGAS